MDKKLKRIEKKLHRAHEDNLDEETKERKRAEKRRLGQYQHEKETARHLVKEGMKEYRSKGLQDLKSTREAFHSDSTARDAKLVSATVGLVTLEELRKKKEEILAEEKKSAETSAERAQREAEEERVRKVKEREKRIKAQVATLSFDPDEL
eukprot:EC723941.1.p1 GENE.EC723941.1~~EC723941.1.p1  ORF type:complete len:151 (+),score=28.55 EC723941.1:139-591(+)